MTLVNYCAGLIRNTPPSRLQDITISIDNIAFGGKGVGRLPSGKACFVPFVIPGERVEASVSREKSSFAEADLKRVLEASLDRVKAPCPVFGQCGGCTYQHISHSRQLDIKTKQVSETLRRLGGVADAPVSAAIASSEAYGYRNRITVHIENGRIGFYEAGTTRVTDVKSCPIASPAVNEQLAELRKRNPRDGHRVLREPGAFRGFRQVNESAAVLLLDTADQMAGEGGGLLVDAYCGAGFFAKRLRTKFRRTIGIEWSVDAVRAASEDLIEGESYVSGDVAEYLPEALQQAEAAETTVLLDPPAEGVAPVVLEALLERKCARIIYVSCDPATLARDLKRLGSIYDLKSVQPVDMFPQTAEIETASLLELR